MMARQAMGGPGRRTARELPSVDDAAEWFKGRLPAQWFRSFDLTADREEIVVIGHLTDVTESNAEAEGKVAKFRSDTRDERIGIALDAESRYDRKVSWGIAVGDETYLFTHVAAPVMTRLRQPERQVLDTLVDAGVAGSRSEALAWCVRRTGEHIQEWLDELRQAMSEVEELRKRGPGN